MSPCEMELSTCSAEITCPQEGLWSEWTTVSTQLGSASCASCGKLYQTRSCASEEMDCPCTRFPRKLNFVNTPMIIDGKMQYGPFASTIRPHSNFTYNCCPVRGIWSKFSGYGRNMANTAWIRTRKCLSESAGCPYIGDDTESQVKCPCRDMTTIRYPSFTERKFGFDYQINDITCTYTARLFSNNSMVDHACDLNTELKYKSPRIRYVIPANSAVCQTDYPFDCERRAPHEKLWISFTCDTEVLYWKYDFTGEYVNGWYHAITN